MCPVYRLHCYSFYWLWKVFEFLRIILIEIVTILMKSAKMATLGLLKIKIFWNNVYDVMIFVHDVTNKVLPLDSYHVVDAVMSPKFGNSITSTREVINNLNFIKIWQEKPHFEGLPWFKFNNLGLALGIALKFYTSVAKESKLKVRKFWCLIRTFVEVTGEKLVGSGVWRVCPLPLPRIGLILSLVFTIIFRFLRNW